MTKKTGKAWIVPTAGDKTDDALFGWWKKDGAWTQPPGGHHNHMTYPGQEVPTTDEAVEKKLHELLRTHRHYPDVVGPIFGLYRIDRLEGDEVLGAYEKALERCLFVNGYEREANRT